MQTKDYRPDIDGLRAIAVLSVLLFHYGATWLPGGFAGVDVFFVISGYLITKHLAEDIVQNGTSILPLLIRFYDKRIRRIVPALVVVLVATLAAGWFLLMPGDYATTGNSAAYSAFGLGNLYFYSNTGYFDREAEMQPLLHMWSLGVEEQFYFVWPILLAGLMFVARGSRTIVAVTIAALVVVGLAYSAQTVAVDPKGAFFLPLPRAWELGVGALLAFLPAIRNRPTSEMMGVAGLALIGGTFAFLAGSETSLALMMVPAVLGSALLIWPRTESAVSGCLAIYPMRFVGKISYSLYLWHWPLIVLFRHYNNGAMPTPVQAALLATIAVGAAYFSWRYVEQPLRKPIRVPIFSIMNGLTASGLVFAVGQLIVQTNGFVDRLPLEAQRLSSLEVMWEWNCPRVASIPGLGNNLCIIGAPWENAKSRGIMWGDSHAEHYAPVLEQAIGDQSISIALYLDCPAALGGSVSRVWPDKPNYQEHCRSNRAQAMKWLSSNSEVRLVLLAGAWEGLLRTATINGTINSNVEAQAKLIRDGLAEVTNKTIADGKTTIILGQVPSIPAGRSSCGLVAAAGLVRRVDPCIGLNKTAYAYTAQYIAPIDQAFRSLSRVTLLSPAQAFCREGECLTQLGGEFLSRDGNHIRRNLKPETRKLIADQIGLTDAISKINHTEPIASQ